MILNNLFFLPNKKQKTDLSNRPATFSVSSFTYKSKQSASSFGKASRPDQTTKTKITDQEKKHKTKNQSNNTQDVQTKKRRYCNIDLSDWDASPDKVTHSNHIEKKQAIDVDKILSNIQKKNKQIVAIESLLEAFDEKPCNLNLTVGRNLDLTVGHKWSHCEVTLQILKCLNMLHS